MHRKDGGRKRSNTFWGSGRNGLVAENDERSRNAMFVSSSSPAIGGERVTGIRGTQKVGNSWNMCVVWTTKPEVESAVSDGGGGAGGEARENRTEPK